MQWVPFVAILSALLSLVMKKLGDVAQAVFGWSITALFGKLGSKKQVLLSVALILSLCWPLFVVGTVLPNTAAWVLAFLPLEKWVGKTTLRIVWVALAVLAPVVVGLLARAVAPRQKIRGSILRSAVGGYPLALGFFCSFVITVITVPLVKIGSLVRGFSESHVYVQPKEGRYGAVVHAAAEACARAGLVPTIEPIPTSMALATKVMKWFAGGTLHAIVADDPRRVVAGGVEVYVYPADFLIRGKEKKAAHVRAMLTQTLLDRDAYLVESPASQRLQDELGEMWEFLVGRSDIDLSSKTTAERLRRLYVQMNREDLPYEDWLTLERIVRRLERRLAGGPTFLDDTETGLEALEKHAAARTRTVMKEETAIEDRSTAELVRDAVREASEVLRLEVELAKKEAETEVRHLAKTVVAFGIAALSLTAVLSLLGVSVVLAFGGSPVHALLVAAAFLGIGAIAVAVAYSQIPKNPLARTRSTLADNVKHLQEHVA